ncbi:MAG: response regulator [Rhodobacterales bacterium]|nr:MAG: response regulator [Rhodobacterales bacterium]
MDSDLHLYLPEPTPERPLNGLSLLIVEDSRCTTQAVRLLALGSGARLRRADSIAAAHRHLAVFRPSVVIVDMGLPDGSGADLIAELARAEPRVPAVIGTSGDAGTEEAAMAAGADGFLAKPIESLALFQQAILNLLPRTQALRGPRALPDRHVIPGRDAVAEDLEHAADMMEHGRLPDLPYAAQFLGTVAQAAHDPTLEAAARRLAQAPAHAPQVARLVADKLAEMRASA